MTLKAPSDDTWYMDTGASSHMTASPGNLSSFFACNTFSSILIGNGARLSISYIGQSTLPNPTRNFSLNNFLVTPNIIKNLIYVRQFTRENNCSIEFDPFGFHMKDLPIGIILLRQ
jgi:hypothetical protein